jgi:hypothetical protein
LHRSERQVGWKLKGIIYLIFGCMPLPLPDFGRKGKMSSPNANGDDELRKTISKNETLAEWGGAAVVFGLLIEVVLTATYRHNESVIEGWGPVFADALIALGVAAEILFARKARSKSEALQLRSELKVAEANARAEESNRLALEAQLDLAKFRSARSLDRAQTERFIEKARVFEGTTFQCGIGSVDSDQFALALHLVDALRKAGWRDSNWRAGQSISSFIGSAIGLGIGPISNVYVGFSRNASETLKTTATAIAKALSEEEIKAAAGPIAQQMAVTDMITILIGRKS